MIVALYIQYVSYDDKSKILGLFDAAFFLINQLLLIMYKKYTQHKRSDQEEEKVMFLVLN